MRRMVTGLVPMRSGAIVALIGLATACSSYKPLRTLPAPGREVQLYSTNGVLEIQLQALGAEASTISCRASRVSGFVIHATADTVHLRDARVRGLVAGNPQACASVLDATIWTREGSYLVISGPQFDKVKTAVLFGSLGLLYLLLSDAMGGVAAGMLMGG